MYKGILCIYSGIYIYTYYNYNYNTVPSGPFLTHCRIAGSNNLLNLDPFPTGLMHMMCPRIPSLTPGR